MIGDPLLHAIPTAKMAADDSQRPDLLFVNPPSPDGDTWIRCQHRAGQRAPDGTVWPQTALAQLAALFPDREVAILDAAARRSSWQQFSLELERRPPRWYVTLVAGPTLESDLLGVVLAKRAGALTVAFGPAATPVAIELLQRCPALDFVLCGEPELTLRELVDTVDSCGPTSTPDAWSSDDGQTCRRARGLTAIRGLAWRRDGEPRLNAPRPLIPRLDDLPLPRHDLLPLAAYRGPAIEAPAAMVGTGRGCPGRCSFCLKHVTYGYSVRLRSPEHILSELCFLERLGVRHVYMQADLFTVCREQVAALCRLMLAEGLRIPWSCASRVDTVDGELLQLMGRAGCRRITWAIESASDTLLWQNGKGTRADEIDRAIALARAAGIECWGSFLIGLPGETDETVLQTIALAKRLALERVTFELAVPRPGTPLWAQAAGRGWLRDGKHWADADVCGPAILDYPWLRATRLEHWLERAYREWAMRPGSLWSQLQHLAPTRAAASLGVSLSQT
ncbi:MAG: B12-binding domain-containing radical SAM protein [Anaerolineae bacterium]|nr:B12-binding domain-containing radical SAM protein [Anaerolineae bacterium]